MRPRRALRRVAPCGVQQGGRLPRPGRVRGLGLRGGRARWRGVHRPHRLAQCSRCRCWPPTVVALSFARVQAALERSHGHVGPGPGDPVRRAQPLLESGHERRRDRRAAGTDGHAARPGNRGPVGAGVADRLRPPDPGRHLASGRRRRPARRPPCGPGHRGRADEGLRALPVRHGAELLGVLRLQERPGLALTLVEERLFAGLAAQAGLVLRLGRAARRARGPSRGADGPRRASSRHPDSGSSRPRTPNVAAWSATSTTAPSSTWWP